MPELSKHDLDKLFQKGAERYDFEYNPAAWEQMAAMLERSRRRALIWWLAGMAAFLLLAGLAFYFFRPEAELVKKNENRKPPRIELAGGTEAKKEERRISGPLPRKASPESSPNAREPNAAPFETKVGEKTLAGPQAPQVAGISRRAMETLPAIYAPIAPEPEQEPVIQTTIGGVELSINKEKRPAAEAPSQLPPPVLPLPLLSIGDNTRDTLAISSRDEKKGRPGPSSHLVAGPSFSAGLNSVGWSSFSRSVWKAGLFAEYRYNGRFGLGLGANYLHTNYVADKGEYIPPRGFWTRRIAPDNTRGVCNILEVPVMLKYYPKGYSTSGPFVSAGLSSYLMLMEEYWYRYALDEPDLIRWWQTTKGQSHWFALGQISAGYQANPGNRWSLQLGPYLQVPISGVGHGQVKIYSLGVDLRILWTIW